MTEKKSRHCTLEECNLASSIINQGSPNIRCAEDHNCYELGDECRYGFPVQEKNSGICAEKCLAFKHYGDGGCKKGNFAFRPPLGRRCPFG